MSSKLVALGAGAAAQAYAPSHEVEAKGEPDLEKGIVGSTLESAGSAVAGIGSLTEGTVKVIFPCLSGKKMRYLIVTLQVVAAGSGVGMAWFGGYYVVGPLLTAVASFGAVDSVNVLKYGTILERMQLNTRRDEAANRAQAEQLRQMAAENGAYHDLNAAHGALNTQFGEMAVKHAEDLKVQKIQAAKMMANIEAVFKRQTKKLDMQVAILKTGLEKFSDSLGVMREVAADQKALTESRKKLELEHAAKIELLMQAQRELAEAEEVQSRRLAELAESQAKEVAAGQKALTDMLKRAGNRGEFIDWIRVNHAEVIDEFEKANAKLD
ncbi:MAG: hypothetical protein P0S95_01560 [Rhabdochlamydiaceae bacterium]|nr:hypothetical protein [Candidatus Amphrikana amoebophyrae]